jgi:peptidoglycan/xylan/chitin deacetylase (PgdA/CDA1 family)
MTGFGRAGAGGLLRNRSAAALFLCYHSVADDGPRWTSVPVARFERQLEMLERSGYRSGGLDDLARITGGEAPRSRLVFLTFDDGFADNAEVVAPLLRERGWKALVFLLPPAVDAGAPLDWPEVRARRRDHPRVMRSLDWRQVESMARDGMEFGSHTNNHLHLPRLGDEELRQELLDSRRRIGERLGRCDALAYPFGDWDGRVLAAAAAAGYRHAFTLPFASQRSAHPLSIPRIAIDHRDDGARFAFKLTPAGRSLLLSASKPWARALRDGTTALLRPRRREVDGDGDPPGGRPPLSDRVGRDR